MAYKVPPKNSQFKPGKSGNPNGRPKQIPALEKLLSDIPETDYEDIIAALVKKAKKGEVRAAEVLFDRAWGKAKESLEITVPASTRNRTGDSSE
jgi:hypothetical protein